MCLTTHTGEYHNTPASCSAFACLLSLFHISFFKFTWFLCVVHSWSLTKSTLTYAEWWSLSRSKERWQVSAYSLEGQRWLTRFLIYAKNSSNQQIMTPMQKLCKERRLISGCLKGQEYFLETPQQKLWTRCLGKHRKNSLKYQMTPFAVFVLIWLRTISELSSLCASTYITKSVASDGSPRTETVHSARKDKALRQKECALLDQRCRPSVQWPRQTVLIT